MQEILRDIPPGYDRPAGSGKLPGFPADVAVKYEALLECGNTAWERLGRLIRGNTLLYGHVTLRASAPGFFLDFASR